MKFQRAKREQTRGSYQQLRDSELEIRSKSGSSRLAQNQLDRVREHWSFSFSVILISYLWKCACVLKNLQGAQHLFQFATLESFIRCRFFSAKTELTQNDVNGVKPKVIINVEKESAGLTVTEYVEMKEKSQNYTQIPV